MIPQVWAWLLWLLDFTTHDIGRLFCGEGLSNIGSMHTAYIGVIHDGQVGVSDIFVFTSTRRGMFKRWWLLPTNELDIFDPR